MTERHRRTIVDLLALQHDRMRELLDDMLGSVGADRRAAFEEFARWLAVHEATEAELMRDAGADPVCAARGERMPLARRGVTSR